MAVRFSWTVQDADGDAQTGLNVDLYYNGGAKLADMTDNGDGSYYCSVAVSGKYDVYIGGVKQDEGTGIYIAADDTPTAAQVTAKAAKVTGATNGNLAGLNASGDLTDSGYAPSSFLGSAHVNANGSGGTSTPATNKVHNAAAIAVTDSGGLLTATDVEAALAEIKTLIGTGSFTTADFIKDQTTITNALLALNNQLYDLYLRGGDNITDTPSTHKGYFVFSYSGNTSTNTIATIGAIAAPTVGLHFPLSGSITGIYLTFEDIQNIITGGTVKIYLRTASGTDTLLTTLKHPDDYALYDHSASFAVGLIPVYPSRSMNYLIKIVGTGSAYITDPIIILEVTFGSATS